MTTLLVYPKGYYLAKRKASAKFQKQAGFHTQKQWKDYFLDELKSCPDVSGTYKSDDKTIEFKPLQDGAPYQAFEGKFDEFPPADVLDIVRSIHEFKRAKVSLKDSIEQFAIKNTSDGSVEYLSTEWLYELSRDAKKCRSLKVGIEADRSLLDRIVNNHDETVYGALVVKPDGAIRFDEGRLTISHHAENGLERVIMRVQEQSMPISYDEWLCLMSFVKIIHNANSRLSNPMYQVREFEGKYEV